MTHYVDTAAIAQMLGLTDRVTKRPDFPPPALKLTRKTVRWKREDIARWIEAQARRCRWVTQSLTGQGGA